MSAGPVQSPSAVAVVLLVIALLSVSGSVDAARRQVSFLADYLYENSDCSGNASAVILAGELAPVCYRVSSLEFNSSVAFNGTTNETLVYVNSPFCNDTATVAPSPWNTCESLPEANQSELVKAVEYPADMVFNVTYFAEGNPSCSLPGVSIYESDVPIFRSGVFNLCVLYNDSAENVIDYGTMVTQRQNSTFANTTLYRGLGCTGIPIETFSYPIKRCVPSILSGGSKLLKYMYVDALPPPTPPSPPYPNFLIGQVDLDASAFQLNAQIVGASVGVLCGFTTLLVALSMTEILG